MKSRISCVRNTKAPVANRQPLAGCPRPAGREPGILGKQRTPHRGARRRSGFCSDSLPGRSKACCGSKSNGSRANPTKAYQGRGQAFPGPGQATGREALPVCPSARHRRRFRARTPDGRCNSRCSRDGRPPSRSGLPERPSCRRERNGSTWSGSRECRCCPLKTATGKPAPIPTRRCWRRSSRAAGSYAKIGQPSLVPTC